ncbi:unnamed protein product [Peronospora farinosa]|uniref:D-isomer specific 2-hydroxyacid dehydrogenase NAD-binding domain-containing protein n=1 Tax=Peronospora farinosa TaxID=134698 RepID=A0ABN8C9J4_9STRA|nr:unnamed protein product [Peronospora farinosa]
MQDDFEQEPLPNENSWWSHPKVIVTPHIAGTVFPEDVANGLVKRLLGSCILSLVYWKVDMNSEEANQHAFHRRQASLNVTYPHHADVNFKDLLLSRQAHDVRGDRQKKSLANSNENL